MIGVADRLRPAPPPMMTAIGRGPELIMAGGDEGQAPWFAAAEVLESWAYGAGAGAQMTYAIAYRLPQRCPVGQAAYALYQDSIIHLVQRARAGLPTLYIAERSSARHPLRREPASAMAARAGLGRVAALMLDLIIAAAQRGERCPPDHELAQMMVQPPHMIARARAEIIASGAATFDNWKNHNGHLWRVVTISDSGISTAGPGPAYKWRVT